MRRLVQVGGVLLLVLPVVAGALSPSALEAAGPWQAQVVDAQTGQPLEGVAVLAVWTRRVYGHPAIGFDLPRHAGDAEVVTNAEGQFHLRARVFFNPTIGVEIKGPELFLFKAGYGGWRFRPGREALTGEGAVIELRPLRTREERLDYLEGRRRVPEAKRWAWHHADRPGNPFDIPWERARRYEAAINAERAALGLEPIGIGYPGLLPKRYWPAPPKEAAGGHALRGAAGVAIDAAGNLYVADTGNHRVVKLSPALEVVATWGRFGRRDGEFQVPEGIAIDSTGAVYVADSGNHRIQKFTPDGRFLLKWGRLRPDDYEDTPSPQTIVVTRADEVYVFDRERGYRYDPRGRRVGAWRPPWLLDSRGHLTADLEGNVYAIDYQGRVLKTDRDGKVLATWGRRGTGPGELSDPIALAADQAGHLYVADWAGPRIHQFDARGAYLGHRGPADAEEGQLRSPYGLAVGRDGTVYVTDSGSAGILKLSPERRRKRLPRRADAPWR